MAGSSALVSVLIPTFNRSGMLTQALESAVRQTYRALEIVVADNASGDDTADVVAAFCRRDGRVRYVRHGTNLGYLGNIQSLLDEAQGEFVKFLMDDDVLLPDCVETLVRPCRRDPSIGFATSKRTYVDPSLRPLPDVACTQALRSEDGVLDGHELGDVVLRANLNVLGEGSTVLFRRSLLSGPDALCFGDHDFEAILDVSMWLKVLSQCRAFYSARPLSLFRAHGGQGGSDYLAPFLGTIEWGRIIDASKQFGFLGDPAAELEALGTFVRTASQIRPRVTDWAHLEMLDEAVARAGDRLAAFARGRGGPEERCADGRASRALREIDRVSALAGAFPAPLPLPSPVPTPSVDVVEDAVEVSYDYDVSIVVVTQNPGDSLLTCLNALSDHTEGCSYEVVIVDRGSNDGTELLLSCLEGDVQVLTAGAESTWPSACSAGVAAGRGRHVVVLPTEAVVEAGWLKELLNTFDGVRTGAVCSGEIVLVKREAFRDAMGLDELEAAGTALSRLLGRMQRRGWSVTRQDQVDGGSSPCPPA